MAAQAAPAPAVAAPAADADQPTGPQQRGRGSSGQYVYWVTQVYPKAETIARLGVKTPDDFDRAAFMDLTGFNLIVKDCTSAALALRSPPAAQSPTFWRQQRQLRGWVSCCSSIRTKLFIYE